MIRPGVKRIFRLVLRRRDAVEAAVDEEIALHLELRARQLEAEGRTPSEARHEARYLFGDLATARRTMRAGAHRREDRLRWREWLDGVGQDVRFGLRSLRHHRVASMFIILTLALGIGANATMFGVVDTLMFRPPIGIAHPDQVVRIYFSFPGSNAIQKTGYGTYMALRDHVAGFQNVAAYSPEPTSIGRGAGGAGIEAVLVTASFFRTLAVHPALGRFFTKAEERAAGTRTVVLGYALWKSRFDGNHAVLGRSVDIAGEPCVVIGVAPRDFTGVDLTRVDAWLPIGMATTMVSPYVLSRTDHGVWLSTVARVRAGVSTESVQAQATAAFAAVDVGRPDTKGAHVVLAPLPVGRGPAVSSETRVSLWLGLVSVLVLLVACANVANLLLARAAARMPEIAVRLSLGAGRRRVARQLFVESLMLAVAGAAAALVLTAWASAFVQHVVAPDVPIAAHATSTPMLVFAGIAALGTGLLCGVAPALLGARSELSMVLKGRSGSVAGGLRTQRLLVAAQMAFTVVLLAGAGLFLRSLRNIRQKDLGMDVHHVLYASVDFRSTGLSSAEVVARYRAMAERVRALPGVTAAGYSNGEPFRSAWAVGIEPTAGPAAAVSGPNTAPWGRAVSAGFFRATGRRFVAGRSFDAADHTATANVAIINETAARYYWGNATPIGACVRMARDKHRCATIIGVVADTPWYFITAAPPQELYVPIETQGRDWGYGPDVSMMEVGTTGDPERMIGAVRRAMLAAGGDIPYPSVEPLTNIIDPQYRSWEIGANMFSAFGALALVLAAVGLYGVMAYAVEQRSREIGIRAALGAQAGTLVRMVVVEGVATALVGTLIGAGAALGGGRFVASLLYHVSAHDPASIGVAAATLVMVAGAASYLPARRAARVDPLTVLRAD